MNVDLTPHIPGIGVLPVRTPTLPPATHTNSWMLGEGAFVVVDPASPWEDEQLALYERVRERMESGERVEGLFLTHHHHDHVAGAQDLRERLRGDGVDVPVIAHPVTAELVDIPVDRFLDEDDVLEVGGRTFDVLHTPGHAPGHLCLHDRASGALVAGDMVAGVGTIAIDPDEGDLGHYLHHLERIRRRAPTALLPAHGPVLRQPDAVLSMYIAHRNGRTEQIRARLEEGSATPLEVARHVYAELDPRYHPLAARQVLTHLHWLEQHGHARADGDTWCLS